MILVGPPPVEKIIEMASKSQVLVYAAQTTTVSIGDESSSNTEAVQKSTAHEQQLQAASCLARMIRCTPQEGDETTSTTRNELPRRRVAPSALLSQPPASLAALAHRPLRQAVSEKVPQALASQQVFTEHKSNQSCNGKNMPKHENERKRAVDEEEGHASEASPAKQMCFPTPGSSDKILDSAQEQDVITKSTPSLIVRTSVPQQISPHDCEDITSDSNPSGNVNDNGVVLEEFGFDDFFDFERYYEE